MYLRDYQKSVLTSLKDRISLGLKSTVIAAAPSSGKTEMAIAFIQDNLDKNILLLPHGTNVIKHQWESRLPKECRRVTVMLHQALNLELKNNPQFLIDNKFDYLIIDEAHEFTFGKQISKNLDRFRGAHVIYLTGTPSKFIALGHDPIIVDAISLIDKGYVADLYCGICSSNVEFLGSDLNRDGNATKSGIKKLDKNVNSDLSTLLDSMYKRLTSSITKDKPVLNEWLKLTPSMGGLDKTIIATDSVDSAHKVAKYFTSKKVTALVSDYKSDPESEKVQEFINSDVKILVVVNRCVLGFNLEHLTNVVDMTGSHNIDRIYQLYARVMRKDKRDPNKKKYFFKIVPENMSDYYKFYMTAALCLMDESFISKYNGKNLNSMEVPVKIQRSSRNSNTQDKQKPQPKVQAIDEIFEATVSATKLMVDIKNQQGRELNEYAYCTLKEAKKGLSTEVDESDLFHSKNKLIEYIALKGYKPEGVEEEEYWNMFNRPSSKYYCELTFLTCKRILKEKQLLNWGISDV